MGTQTILTAALVVLWLRCLERMPAVRHRAAFLLGCLVVWTGYTYLILFSSAVRFSDDPYALKVFACWVAANLAHMGILRLLARGKSRPDLPGPPPKGNRRMLLRTLGLILLGLNLLHGLFDFMKVYQYSTLHGEVRMWEMPSKGGGFRLTSADLSEHRKQHPESRDTVLYRSFRINPLCVWRWSEYLYHPRYRLPYLETQDSKDAPAQDRE